jgi:hypothetical protein
MRLRERQFGRRSCGYLIIGSCLLLFPARWIRALGFNFLWATVIYMRRPRFNVSTATVCRSWGLGVCCSMSDTLSLSWLLIWQDSATKHLSTAIIKPGLACETPPTKCVDHELEVVFELGEVGFRMNLRCQLHAGQLILPI